MLMFITRNLWRPILTGASAVPRVMVSLIVMIGALLILGVFVPFLPYLGALGTISFSLFMPWLAIFTALTAVLSGWHWHRQRRRMTMALCVIGLCCTAGATAAYVRIINTARANGVTVDLAKTFSLSFVGGGSSPDATVAYTAFAGAPLDLDIFRPSNPSGVPGAPVLLYVHGGGWIGGSKANRSKDMRWFANQGWLVISIDYTLSTAGRPLWNETTPQLGCAMAWVAAHAKDYRGDPAHLAMVGDSAGGNLVLNASYMANSGVLTSSCGGKAPKVRAVIATYPVVDVASFYSNPDPLLGRFSRLMATTYTGGTPQAFPGRYAAVRSANYIGAAAPPTLIIVGKSDHLVPPQPAYDFVRQARAAEVVVSIIRMPYCDHAFDVIQNGIGDQVFRQATMRFLRQNI